MSRPGPEETASRAASVVQETLRRLAPIDLDEIDRATALQRRVDRKYLLEADRFPELVEQLAEDHRVSTRPYRVGIALLTGDRASAGPAARWFSM
jgi:hypothetical protein